VGADWQVIEAIGPVKETASRRGRCRAAMGAFRSIASRRVSGQDPSLRQGAQKKGIRKSTVNDYHYDMDDAAIYCSELIYKAFRTATGEELGHLQKLGETPLEPYEPVIKQLEGGQVPLERLMITRAPLRGPQLEKVFEQKE